MLQYIHQLAVLLRNEERLDTMVSANNGKFRKDVIRSLTARLAIKMLVTVLVVVNLIRGRRIVVLLTTESTRSIAHNTSLISICFVS